MENMPQNNPPDESSEGKNSPETEKTELKISPEIERLLEGSEKLKEGQERTNEIEGALERIEKAKLGKPPKDPSKLKRWLQIATAALAIGGGSFVAQKGYDAFTEKQEEKAVQLEKERKKEVLREDIKERINLDLVEIANDTGFKVSLEVDNNQGEYIVHVGQIHSSGDTVLNILGSGKIINSQKRIEKLFNGIIDERNDVNHVFSESIDSKSIESLEREKGFINSIQELEPSFENLKLLGRYFYKISMEGNERADIFVIKTIEEKVEEIKDFLIESGDEEYKKFLQAREDLGIPSGGIMDRDYQSRKSIGFGDDAETAYGVARKMYFEGKIEILPSEITETNKKAFEALKKMEEGIEKAREKIDRGISDEEKEKLIEKLEKLERAFDEAQEERDRVAIELIAEEMNNLEHNINLLIYGDAHDFKENVEEWNEQNPDQKIGLIKLTLKDLNLD